MIDATILMENKDGQEKLTALEIKTGKSKPISYRGQVLLYSLLIAERFKNANDDNILLYIMDEKVSEGFEILKNFKN
jgi:CRISPR/Cas system-associated exonuclease Cas4 (RecB family)